MLATLHTQQRQSQDSCKRVASFTNTFGTPIDLDPLNSVTSDGHGGGHESIAFDSDEFDAFSEAVGYGGVQSGASRGSALWARLTQLAKV